MRVTHLLSGLFLFDMIGNMRLFYCVCVCVECVYRGLQEGSVNESVRVELWAGFQVVLEVEGRVCAC